MKAITNTLILALVLLSSYQPATAQSTPSVSTAYSNSEIQGFIKSYKSVKSHDTQPVKTLEQKFLTDFPGAKDIDWEKGAGIYEVEFEIGRTDYKAYYNEKADLLMYVLDIKDSLLPAIVKNAAIAKYPNYTIEDRKKVIQGSETFYIIELEKERTEIKATFSTNGTFIKEVTDK